tara:strand:+ start:7904 stop:8761 length:858 start_codon:yes stop_codon:yes gene_type:complete
MALYRGMDAEELEFQYELRNKEPDFDALVVRWMERCAAFREESDVALDLRYGPAEREVLDLFRGAEGGPVLVYIHGGYWQRGDKAMYSFVAEPFMKAGVNVSVINYTLTPDCRLGDIAPQVRRAITWLWHNAADLKIDREMISVMGHSAGGHLTAMMMATDWPAHDPAMPADAIHAGVPISGIFELEPLVHTSINQGPQMDVEEAKRESPLFLAPTTDAPQLVVAGGNETPEFKRQSDAYVERYRTENRVMERHDVPNENHFGELERLAESDSEVFQRSIALVGR